MSAAPLASVVVNNHNYGRFLRAAIDSALAQTHAHTEVIVVDDGSGDDSREIIREYGSRVTPVLQERGGQAAAFNAGFARSRGEVVLFLDADDVLLPTAVETAVRELERTTAVKVHWPLWEIDEDGARSGRTRPGQPLAEGDLSEVVAREGPGPESYATPPTSGNAWARRFLEAVLPMPAARPDGAAAGPGGMNADAYLATLAPLFGPLAAWAEPLGEYRVHGGSAYAALPFEDKLRFDLWSYDYRCKVLARHCRERGIEADPAEWRRRSWLHRFVAARAELAEVVPAGETVILVDGQQVGRELALGRRALPFLERDGTYWGAPPDGATAVSELSRLREAGAGFIAFAWPAFWWLDHYPELAGHLEAHFRCALRNERLVVFDLRAPAAAMAR